LAAVEADAQRKEKISPSRMSTSYKI